jgi:hypothetical protein
MGKQIIYFERFLSACHEMRLDYSENGYEAALENWRMLPREWRAQRIGDFYNSIPKKYLTKEKMREINCPTGAS